MRIIAIIPSRYGSSRFPGKPLALICGKPMIQWVYETVKKVERINEVYVATDNELIFEKVNGFGGKAIMTSDKHTCGTDRISECAKILKIDENDLILNIQGDEPLIKTEMIDDLIDCFDEDNVYFGTLKKEIDDVRELNDTNVVKVITDVNNNAIYFSRYCIPFNRDGVLVKHYKHVGAYAYKRWFLDQFSKMPKTCLEISESLEQLRAIENGYKIKVKETKYKSVGVDSPEHIKIVERMLEEENE